MENGLAFAVLSNPRVVRGHTLIIPKRHVEKPWELTENELKDVWALLHTLQKKIVDSGLGMGCDMRQHYKPFVKETRIKVDHVHYHLIPRFSEDTIKQKVDVRGAKLFEDLSKDEEEEVYKILK